MVILENSFEYCQIYVIKIQDGHRYHSNNFVFQNWHRISKYHPIPFSHTKFEEVWIIFNYFRVSLPSQTLNWLDLDIPKEILKNTKLEKKKGFFNLVAWCQKVSITTSERLKILRKSVHFPPLSKKLVFISLQRLIKSPDLW